MRRYVIDAQFVKAYVEKPYLVRGKTEDEINKQWLRQTYAALAEIKRHCDSFSDFETDNESHWECSFCGGEGDSKDDYECCDEAMDERNARDA